MGHFFYISRHFILQFTNILKRGRAYLLNAITAAGTCEMEIERKAVKKSSKKLLLKSKEYGNIIVTIIIISK